MESQITYVGHRGAAYLAPENTLASLQLAWELGADAAECDILMTKDNQVIVFHDYKGKKLLNKDCEVKNTNYNDLKELPIKLRKSNLKKYEGQTIPLLSQALQILPKNKTLVIEIKTGTEILPHLKKVIDTHWKNGKIAFIAFDYDCIIGIKELYPKVPAYFLAYKRKDLNKKFEAIINSNLDGIDLYYKIIDKKLVDKFKKHGKDTWCWTVNTSRSALKMAKCGVFCITTDRPKWLKQKVEAKKQT